MSKKDKRKPSFALAVSPIIIMFLLIGIGYGVYGLRIEILVLIAAIYAALVAMYLGYNWGEIEEAIVDKISKAMGATLILICVGALVGSWMSSGTIPMLVYYGLKYINPDYIAVAAFIGGAVISLCTGTSWGSAATIGVAMMSVAAAMGANLPLVAGAAVSGAYLGDHFSPISDTVILSCVASRGEVYKHLRHIIYTALGPTIICLVVYWIAGSKLSGGAVTGASNEYILSLIGELDSMYNFNFWVLIPAIIVLVGSIAQKPALPVMIVSCISAVLVGRFTQGISLSSCFESLVSGFNLDMLVTKGIDLSAVSSDITNLLNRGGMFSMLDVVLISFCAYAFAGALDLSNSLDVVLETMLSKVKSVLGLVGTTTLACVVTAAVTSNGQLAVLLPGEMFADEYIKRGLEPENLSRTLEDAGTLIEPILPWTAAGVYLTGVLGVPTLKYLPWAIFMWLPLIFGLICAATGIGIDRIDESSPNYEEHLELKRAGE